MQKSVFRKFSARAVHKKETLCKSQVNMNHHPDGSLKIIMVAGEQQGVRRDPLSLRSGAKYTLRVANLVPSVLSRALCDTSFSGVVDPCHQLKVNVAANSSRGPTE